MIGPECDKPLDEAGIGLRLLLQTRLNFIAIKSRATEGCGLGLSPAVGALPGAGGGLQTASCPSHPGVRKRPWARGPLAHFRRTCRAASGDPQCRGRLRARLLALLLLVEEVLKRLAAGRQVTCRDKGDVGLLDLFGDETARVAGGGGEAARLGAEAKTIECDEGRQGLWT